MSSVRRTLKAHPCHQCPERENHARIFERFDRLDRETAGLQARMEGRTNVIPRTFDQVTSILESLDYIAGERLCPKGATLTKIYAENDLLLAEMLYAGLFDDASAADLVAILSSLIFEGRGERSKIPRLPKSIEPLTQKVIGIWANLIELEEEHGLKAQREPNFDMAWSAYRWCNGNALNSVLRESEITVGDFVRLMRQVIDLLGQLLAARPEMAPLIREALKRIDRGVVAYSAVVA